jgi:hypothetical protein
MERVNLHLPVSLTTQTDMRRGWGKLIDESVSVLSASVFNDRFDRVQCKKELVRCMEDNRITPDHWYAKAIVSDNPEELDVNFSTVDDYDLEAVRKVFTRHYEQSDDTADEEDEFFLHSDLTIADLKSYDHSRDGGGITQSKWKKRVRALETAINNEIESGADGYEYMEGDIRGLIDEIYDVGEKTQDKYIDEMRITWVDLVDIDADGWAKRVKGLLYDHYFGDKSKSSVGRKVENTPAYKFCLKQKQTIKKATGTMPRELAIKRVENLLDETVVKHKVSGITKRQYEAQATLDDNAENRLEELKMNW